MAKWVFSSWNYTPVATADNATIVAPYLDIRGGSATQTIDFLEVKLDGLAGASAPTPMSLARVTSIASGIAAVASPAAVGPLHPATAALAAPWTAFTSAATGPSRSNATSDAKLDMGLNSFGGIVRWNAAPTQQWTLLGNTSQFGETVLSCQNAGTPGALNTHIMFEPY